MPSLISVEGIECYSYHGCLPEEAIIGNRYLVDVYIYADVSKSLATDNLQDTVDYGLINNVVVKQMTMRSNLIEHVAGRILIDLREQIGTFEKIQVRVTKFNPPVNGNVHKTSFLISSEDY
jgi:dihydroneopterin aldolase